MKATNNQKSEEPSADLIRKFEKIYIMVKEKYGYGWQRWHIIKLFVRITFHEHDEARLLYYIHLMRMYHFIEVIEDADGRKWRLVKEMPKINIIGKKEEG